MIACVQSRAQISAIHVPRKVLRLVFAASLFLMNLDQQSFFTLGFVLRVFMKPPKFMNLCKLIGKQIYW